MTWYPFHCLKFVSCILNSSASSLLAGAISLEIMTLSFLKASHCFSLPTERTKFLAWMMSPSVSSPGLSCPVSSLVTPTFLLWGTAMWSDSQYHSSWCKCTDFILKTVNNGQVFCGYSFIEICLVVFHHHHTVFTELPYCSSNTEDKLR